MSRLFCLALSVGAQQKDPPKKFTNSLGMEFARIPKGKSWLGGFLGGEGTKEVNISQGFYLGVYVVTQDEWRKIMGRGWVGGGLPHPLCQPPGFGQRSAAVVCSGVHLAEGGRGVPEADVGNRAIMEWHDSA